MQTALFDTMARQVAAQREAGLAQAQTEADAILAEADARIRALREEVLANAKTDVDLYVKRARQIAAAEADREVLAMHQALADQVLDQTQQALQRIATGPDFGPVLDALLAELIPASPQDAIILAPPAHVDRCKAWLSANGRGSMRVEADPDLLDGVAAQDANHTFRITNALSTRYRILEGEARKQCLKTLFEGKAGS